MNSVATAEVRKSYYFTLALLNIQPILHLFVCSTILGIYKSGCGMRLLRRLKEVQVWAVSNNVTLLNKTVT